MSKSHGEPIIDIGKGTLHAVRDEQPSPGKSHPFFATVDIEVEVDWKVDLVEAQSPGTNPLTKPLRFHVHRPTGPHSNAIAKRTVRYDEKLAKAKYIHATIEDGAQTQTVQVALVV